MARHFLLLVLALCGSTSFVCSFGDGNTTLSLAVFLSLSSPDVNGYNFLPSLDIALELINNRSDLLPGFILKAERIGDSACSAGSGVKSFIDLIFVESEVKKVAIVGPICSTATQPVTELAQFWNLAVISPTASSPALSDQANFPNFARAVTSDVVIADSIVALMRHYGWSQMAAITQQEFLFTKTYSKLKDAIAQEDDDWTVFNVQFATSENPQSHVTDIYDSPYRIIFLNTYAIYAIEILCQAYTLGMNSDDGYVWLVYGWNGPEWWTLSVSDSKGYEAYNCSREQIERMVQESIALDHYIYIKEDNNSMTDIGISPAQYASLYNKTVQESYADEVPNPTIHNGYQPLFVDAMWATALALNATEAELNKENKSLSEFSYDSMIEAPLIFNHIINRTFVGLTGIMSFNENGDRKGFAKYYKYRGDRLNYEVVAYHSSSSDEVILMPGESVDTIFTGGVVPKDKDYNSLNIALSICYCILAAIGIVYTGVWFVFELVFRKKKIVKMSSPYLNLVICIGAMMLYFEVILLGIDKSNLDTCMALVWIAAVAFTLMFGTMFIKMWRVYYIFHQSHRNRQCNKWLVHDGFLFIIVVILLLIDFCLLIPATSVPSAILQASLKEVPSTDHSLPIQYYTCSSQHQYEWLGVLLGYKTILLVVGLFLAFETRKVQIKHLNDSRLIATCIYSTVILCIALIPIGVTLETHVDAYFAIIGILTMFGATFLVTVLFVPKVYSLLKNAKEGERTATSTFGTETTAKPSVQVAESPGCWDMLVWVFSSKAKSDQKESHTESKFDTRLSTIRLSTVEEFNIEEKPEIKDSGL